MADPAPPGQAEVILAMARSLHRMGDDLVDKARARLDSGEIELTTYYEITAGYQRLVAQANQITQAASRALALSVATEMAQLAAQTERLEAGYRKLRRIEDLLKLGASLVTVAVALALAVLTPGAATLASAAAALATALEQVGAEARRHGID